MIMFAVPIRRTILFSAHSIHCRNQAAKEKVLHHGQLPQHLLDEHLLEASLDLVPALGSADVVEHGRVPAQALDVLDRVDEGHLVEVEEVRSAFLQRQRAVDSLRRDEFVADELAGAEQERQELVVIEPPHAVRPGRLEVVRRLHRAHESQVARENDQRELWEAVAW